MAIFASSVPDSRPRRFASNLMAGGTAIALLYFGREFVITLITAVTIGFLLEPFVTLAMKLRLPRALASFVVCTLALLLVYAVGLGMYAQAHLLVEDLPSYSSRISELAEDVTRRVESAERTAYQILAPRRLREQEEAARRAVAAAAEAKQPRRRSAEPPMPIPAPPQITEVRIRPDRTPVMDYLYRHWNELYRIGLLASFVPFLVYFMLSWRDHLRRSYLQLFRGTQRHAAGRSWQGIADMARAYVVGNFLLGLFLTLASGIFFWAIKLPYFLLVAPLSAFLSLVPYLGLPLAMLPPFFAALPVHNTMAPYLLMATVIGFLHLLALNLLYPKLVGSRVHLNPLAVTVALMFWATIWGAAGLVFAIPITAGMKAVCDNVPGWQAYGKILGD